MLLKEHTNENGSPKVLLVTHKNGAYLIEWGKKEVSCQHGINRADDETGKVEVLFMSIC